MELHCSQTKYVFVRCGTKFEYPMELHCSQTYKSRRSERKSLSTLWNYTALKHACRSVAETASLSTLWNYTALKRCFVDCILHIV